MPRPSPTSAPAASSSPTPSISEVFDEVEREKIHCGVVPIENSSEGSVKQTLDRLVTTPMQIRAEIFLRVSHSLLSTQEDLSRIRRVYSHPQALAQCRIWLRTNLPHAELIAADNTAAAARRAFEEPDVAASVGNIRAASIYNLKVVMEGIEDNPSNTTRFIVIGREAISRPDRTRPRSSSARRMRRARSTAHWRRSPPRGST